MSIQHFVRLTAVMAGIALLPNATAYAAEENEFAQELLNLARTEIAPIVSEAIVLDAIRAQNTETGSLPQSEIDALDTQWRAEIDAGADERPLITETMSNAASQYLASVQEESRGLYTEIFVMDAVGLNVAQSSVTSDYWQGDEAKFQESFGLGADAIHIGEIEFDESSQSYQSQVSMPVVDPDTGLPIGAITVGVDIQYLE